MWVFFKNSRKFATSPSPALGCYWLYNKNYQPKGVTVHSHCVESSEVSYTDVGEGGVAVNCEKTHFFLNNFFQIYLYLSFLSIYLYIDFLSFFLFIYLPLYVFIYLIINLFLLWHNFSSSSCVHPLSLISFCTIPFISVNNLSWFLFLMLGISLSQTTTEGSSNHPI